MFTKNPFRAITTSILLYFNACLAFEVEKFELSMPHAKPTQPDSYLCTPVKVIPGKTYYVVGFEPKATMHVAHHVLVYGCAKPGSYKQIWNCGEMTDYIIEGEINMPCQEDTSILYAWARDAPPLELPTNVGFKIGEGTSVQYLVLQVHYADTKVFENGYMDTSGVVLKYTEHKLNKLAGVLLLGTGGRIPPMSTESMEAACTIEEPKVLHPFAYRTHTHSLGVLVSGYRVRRGENGVDQWTLIGSRDPMTPQMFYPVKNNVTIVEGDRIAASCKMVSTRKYVTYIGTTSRDEMCNFYVMYWVKDTEPLDMKYCFTKGPPAYHWSKDFNSIPLAEQIIKEQYLN